MRKRNPSPTPSAVSSASSTSHHSNNINGQNLPGATTTAVGANPDTGVTSNKKGLNSTSNSLGVNVSFSNQTPVLNGLTPSHPKFGKSQGLEY